MQIDREDFDALVAETLQATTFASAEQIVIGATFIESAHVTLQVESVMVELDDYPALEASHGGAIELDEEAIYSVPLVTLTFSSISQGRSAQAETHQRLAVEAAIEVRRALDLVLIT